MKTIETLYRGTWNRSQCSSALSLFLCLSVLLSIVLPITVLPAVARAQDGAAIIEELQNRFRELDNLEARFEKRHYWKLVDQEQETKGRLTVQKPNRFRFETSMQTVVTDGKTAWNFVPGNDQVIVSDYEAVKGDRSYEKLLFDLILLGGYDDRFEPRYAGEERVGGAKVHRVDLRSVDEDGYISDVTLWIDRRQALVRKVEYRNINNDVTTYELSDFRVNRRLKDAIFTFEVPGKVDVVDLR